MTRNLTPEQQNHLATLLPQGSLITEPADCEAYATDETREHHFLPDAVARVHTVEQVSAILAYCNEQGIPVVPRGGGSGVSGGALAVNGGVILCLNHMNRVLAINHRDMTCTVEVGKITGELKAELREQNLWLPPDPGSAAWCRIGGNLAEAAAGPKSVKYGAFRNWVLNMEVVLPDGTVFWTGADVRKFASGYNLTQLILGSQGTLAVITKAVFRLITPPTEENLLRVAFPTVEAAGETICALFQAGLTPSEVEFLERDAVTIAAKAAGEPIDAAVGAYLWIGFDGNHADQLLAEAETAAHIAEAQGASETLFADTPTAMEKLCRLRKRVGTAVIEQTPFRDLDLTFPRGRLAEIVNLVKAVGREYGFESAIFGHAGDGNLHVNVLRNGLDNQTWNQSIIPGIQKIYDHTIAIGGAPSGEHGLGMVTARYQPEGARKSDHHLAFLGNALANSGILNPDKQKTFIAKMGRPK
ncbi:FAD-binding oxidoreductase [Acanthopleuribacter pedis]|uniref:FAD-binding oxidoreductase n=1 Tax=Acanthopleuribacter pedis TaxID=442870 RepID=A0A8J7QDB2_9BACT|nr:FAD-binding oxidoreductase [Acanthopleuribacter pedis]MBO1317495.1 FAD-binding oxidoreductase [Acanthopleuribacter pedis]